MDKNNSLQVYDEEKISSLTTALESSGILEKIIMENDLSNLNSSQKMTYVKELCAVLSLNPASQPFAFIKFQGALKLYPTKNCAEQLRNQYRISVRILTENFVNDEKGEPNFYKVTVEGQIGQRVDQDVAMLYLFDKYNKKLTGQDLGNAVMKTITKAKRRLTLSMCGLSFDKTNYNKPNDFDDLDDESFNTVAIDPTTGEVISKEPTDKPLIEKTTSGEIIVNSKTKLFDDLYDLASDYMNNELKAENYNVQNADVRGWLNTIGKTWYGKKYATNGWQYDGYKDLQNADIEKLINGLNKALGDPMCAESIGFSTILDNYKKSQMIKLSPEAK